MKHLQMEQLHQLQKRSEGNAEHTEIGDIFQVIEKPDDDTEADKNDGETRAKSPAQGNDEQGRFHDLIKL